MKANIFFELLSWLYGYDCSNGSTIVDYTLVMTPNEAAQTRADKGHEKMEEILTQVLETQAPSVIPGFVAGSVDVTATGRFELSPSIMTLVRVFYWYRNMLLSFYGLESCCWLRVSGPQCLDTLSSIYQFSV